MKIIDIIHQCYEHREACFSFEYYPPKMRERWDEFYEKIRLMSRLGPKFIDVTWGTGDPTSLATLEISRNIQAQTNIDTMMHLTCTHRSRQELMDILSEVRRDTQIRNIMALRGNRPLMGNWAAHPEGFQCASELVDGIRKAFGDEFCISVAGYPEGHREDGKAPSPEFRHTQEYRKQIDYLREKVGMGADFIVTQLCFDMEQLCRYRDDCASAGISCPIVPGILPIHSRMTWQKIATFSASIPNELLSRYETASVTDESLEEFAVELLHEQIDYLHAHGFMAIHLYTLNHARLISRAFGNKV